VREVNEVKEVGEVKDRNMPAWWRPALPATGAEFDEFPVSYQHRKARITRART